MESRILDHRTRYELIKKRQSFSFEKSRIGYGYLIKITFLSLFILSLLWYAGQKENNPFNNKDQISVMQKDGKTLIASITSPRKSKTITLFSPDNWIPCLKIFKKTNKWILIYSNNQSDSLCDHNIPYKWAFIDTTVIKKTPAGWPEPVSILNIKDLTSITASHIPVLSDGTRGIYLHIKNCDCLIIHGDSISEGFEVNKNYKEKIELLVVVNQTSETIKKLHAAVRPSYLVTNTIPDDDLKRLSNILYLNDSTLKINFKIQHPGKLTLSSLDKNID